MTTIIYQAGVGIAADRMVTAGDDIMPPRSKLHAFGPYVSAVCGTIAPAIDVVLMLEDYLIGEDVALDTYAGDFAIRRALQPLLGDLAALNKELREAGDRYDGYDTVLIDRRRPYAVLTFSSGAHLFSVTDLRTVTHFPLPFESWGSGADVAKGAVAAGAPLAEAIDIASRLTIGTSAAYDFIPIPLPGDPA